MLNHNKQIKFQCKNTWVFAIRGNRMYVWHWWLVHAHFNSELQQRTSGTNFNWRFEKFGNTLPILAKFAEKNTLYNANLKNAYLESKWKKRTRKLLWNPTFTAACFCSCQSTSLPSKD